MANFGGKMSSQQPGMDLPYGGPKRHPKPTPRGNLDPIKHVNPRELTMQVGQSRPKEACTSAISWGVMRSPPVSPPPFGRGETTTPGAGLHIHYALHQGRDKGSDKAMIACL
ncbi:hypothetical protein Taro_036042 [Colocasia esculenta]|uniref:Uncharacterized protein n=1 Tax=Colocasia esculenta TaxID=4460 RepID=A0A843W0I5_COLES|nr:hypothetical protein [Colocasia esculenta]